MTIFSSKTQLSGVNFFAAFAMASVFSIVPTEASGSWIVKTELITSEVRKGTYGRLKDEVEFRL